MKEKKFEVIEGTYGPRLVVRSSWSAELENMIAKQPITGLELNHAKGWYGLDVHFLKYPLLQNLQDLVIINFRLDDCTDIHYLHNLKQLSILTYCKTPIDFTAFPQLESVGLEWRGHSTSIFHAKELRHVFLNNYTGKSLSPFAQLEKLEYLCLKSPRIIEIGNLSKLQKLKELALVNATRLVSLEGLQVLKTLEHLEVNHCRRITSIEEIGFLTELRHLEIWDNREIDSLHPLLSLKKLEELYFYESTNILDGDVACLKQLPRLRDTSFGNRRHYNCKIEELYEYLKKRSTR